MDFKMPKTMQKHMYKVDSIDEVDGEDFRFEILLKDDYRNEDSSDVAPEHIMHAANRREMNDLIRHAIKFK